MFYSHLVHLMFSVCCSYLVYRISWTAQRPCVSMCVVFSFIGIGDWLLMAKALVCRASRSDIFILILQTPLSVSLRTSCSLLWDNCLRLMMPYLENRLFVDTIGLRPSVSLIQSSKPATEPLHWKHNSLGTLIKKQHPLLSVTLITAKNKNTSEEWLQEPEQDGIESELTFLS